MKKWMKQLGHKKCAVYCGRLLCAMVVVELIAVKLVPLNTIPFNLMMLLVGLLGAAVVLFLQGVWTD
ncbi:hypothetical protein [Intestinibacillus massiliensis]|uniref:hypothetical protein n=1 Tax=Intestinibacillus massiliensis TaxID=1871029 RepID=UPI000B363694|nr:hypothetical protein [Intestinibacillus massiliensis]